MATATATMQAQEAVYEWSYGASAAVKATDAAAEVQAIYAAQGSVTPEAVVEVARPSGALLHPAFEWDDAIAAEAHRTEQARSLLRRLTVTYRKDDGSVTQPTRFLVKLQARPDEDVEDQTLQAATEPYVYIPVKRVMEDDVLRRKYVREAYLSALSWRRRYQHLNEFASIFAAIDKAAAKFAVGT